MTNKKKDITDKFSQIPKEGIELSESDFVSKIFEINKTILNDISDHQKKILALKEELGTYKALLHESMLYKNLGYQVSYRIFKDGLAYFFSERKIGFRKNESGKDTE
ncbi:hypothetical protein JXM83_05320 [Candidatus Woesearchaeota archaeon]|nr:hypothetical protein [Candidatus Woesearchaeota archaeon]